MKMPSQTLSVATLAICMLGLINMTHASTAGSVLLVKGVVTATPEGSNSRTLDKGAPVNAGEVIATAKKSFVVIKMIDETKLTLKPNSTIVIGNFDMTEGKEEGCLNLLKGGLRTLTGLIAKRRPEAFQLDSPVATIGIRGTDFIARICSGDECLQDEQSYLGDDYIPVEQPTLPESINDELPDGLYSSCKSGSIAVSQCAGQIEDFEVGKCRINQQKDCVDVVLNAGQAGYVSYGATELDEQSGILQFIPKFLQEDPYFRLSELNEETLDLIELFKDEFSTEEQCEISM